ncbi:hypothetical protein M3J09_000343 [Ascochyta lentis]
MTCQPPSPHRAPASHNPTNNQPSTHMHKPAHLKPNVKVQTSFSFASELWRARVRQRQAPASPPCLHHLRDTPAEQSSVSAPLPHRSTTVSAPNCLADKPCCMGLQLPVTP